MKKEQKTNKEKTVIIVKPDGVQKKLIGEVVKNHTLKGMACN